MAIDMVSAIVWCRNMATAIDMADVISMSIVILMAIVIVLKKWFRRLTVIG